MLFWCFLGPLRALGECCGIRIRVRISGSCFGGVLPKDLRQLRPWGPLRGSERGPGSGGAPVALEGCGPSWVPAWALGGVLRDPDPRPGLRQLLRGVLPKDLRQLRPWGPLRGSECGRGSPAGLRLSWKAAGLPGYQRGPWVSAAAPDPRPVLRLLLRIRCGYFSIKIFRARAYR